MHHLISKRRKGRYAYLLVFFFSLYRCMASPRFLASSSMSTLVAASIFKPSPLTRIDCSMNWTSLELLEHLGLLKPDLPIGRLLLSDVAGPWLDVGLFKLFCISKIKYKEEKANKPLTMHKGWGLA